MICGVPIKAESKSAAIRCTSIRSFWYLKVEESCLFGAFYHIVWIASLYSIKGIERLP